MKKGKIAGIAAVLALTGSFAVHGAGSAEAPGAANASGLKPVTLSWYLPQTVQPDQEAVFTEFNKVLKEKLNTTVEFHFIDWGDYANKMKVMTAAGEKMDLIFTSNWTNDYVTGVNQGAFAPIPMKTIENLAPNIVKTVPAKVWPAAQVKGELYAIPNIQVEARWPAFWLQKRFVDKYQFDVSKVKAIKDLTPLLERIAKNERDIVPVDLTANSQLLGYYVTKMNLESFGDDNPNGLYLNDSSLKVVNLYETPEMKDFLSTLRDWYQKGIIQRDAPALKDNMALKQSGKVASFFGVLNPDTAVNQARLMGLKPEDLVAIPLSEPFMYTGSIINTLTAVSATSKNQDRAIMVLNLMFDSQDTRLLNLLNFGIEGKHYKKLGPDLIEPIPNSGYYVDCGWEYGCIFNSYRTNPNQPAWYPAGPNLNERALVSKALGFSFDPTPVKTEMAQVQSVLSEYRAGIFTGAIDPADAVPAMNDKLKKAGNDKIIAEMQRQIDAWKATKK